MDPHLVSLLALPGLGPRRLTALVAAFGSPADAWHAVREDRLGGVDLPIPGAKRSEVVRAWRQAAQRIEADVLLRQHRAFGITILDPGHPAWPEAFRGDPEPPRLLFTLGDPAVLHSVSVAIVGTRRCTAAGAAVARELGHDLGAAGVGVVSGLALGIDGAAHRGSMRADGPTIGVVATGLDVVYPRRHADLWHQVATRGVLVSEAPLGTSGERWRFPSRNRLIASLAQVVVVVESGITGGSMSTVDAAVDRGVTVMAVPGPVRSPASAGSNQLLADGCGVVRDATDVLVALGSSAPSSDVGSVMQTALRFDDDPVAQAVSVPASSLEEIVGATGLSFGEVATRLATLELEGVIERVPDGYQRVSS